MLFNKCCHPSIPQHREKAWLNPSSEAFVALQNILLDKTLLSDLKHLTNFSHTGSLEIYHSSYKGSFKHYVTPEGKGRVANFVTNRYGNYGKRRGGGGGQ